MPSARPPLTWLRNRPAHRVTLRGVNTVDLRVQCLRLVPHSRGSGAGSPSAASTVSRDVDCVCLRQQCLWLVRNAPDRKLAAHSVTARGVDCAGLRPLPTLFGRPQGHCRRCQLRWFALLTGSRGLPGPSIWSRGVDCVGLRPPSARSPFTGPRDRATARSRH